MHPKAIAMLFLGFSAGIPILLIFSTLSVWLREAGVDRSAVTFFSWAALGYSFKFLWAPIIDMLPLPFLTRTLGRRRAWLIIAQGFIIVAILWMASVDPADNPNNLTLMAMAAVLLGFSSASQDVVIDAYRIESADKSLQALLSSMYIAGYRMGMLVAGAGSLFLADYLGGNDGYSYHAWHDNLYGNGSDDGLRTCYHPMYCRTRRFSKTTIDTAIRQWNTSGLSRYLFSLCWSLL